MHQQSWSPDLYTRAYWFAAQAHLGQQIKGGDLPYIVHPSLVCMEVIAALRVEPGRDEDLAVQCALLHDVVEDSGVTYEQLRETFGVAVAEGVQALSKDESLPDDQQLVDSLRRIQQQPPEIGMVKLADRIANLRPPPADWTPAKIRSYWDAARLIHQLIQPASAYLAGRLADKIQAYRAFVPAE
jgi:guanosine-3',5'-bis(diphosphate) 3'-pyrophosphohydrolase